MSQSGPIYRGPKSEIYVIIWFYVSPWDSPRQKLEILYQNINFFLTISVMGKFLIPVAPGLKFRESPGRWLYEAQERPTEIHSFIILWKIVR